MLDFSEETGLFPFDYRHRIEELFRELIHDPWCDRQEQPWQPFIDVVDSFDHVLVLMDLPGIDPDRLSIDMRENVLTVSGHRREHSVHVMSKRLCERHTGPFSRSVTLNPAAHYGKPSMEYRDGVLRIKIGKLPS